MRVMDYMLIKIKPKLVLERINPMDYNKMFSGFEYFSVNVNEYVAEKSFVVTRAASLNNPKDNSVMFIQKQYLKNADSFLKASNCLIFWPNGHDVPAEVEERHAVYVCDNPHLEFCFFFKKHNITNYVQLGEIREVDYYILCGNVEIGEGTKVFPYVYINGNVHIGKNCYIGAGTKIIGNVYIGDNVIVRENTVLGADGLTTDRDENGEAVSMPQFGGLVVEDNVQIGANTVIARGAIDNTVIRRGCKIDNCCWISHNNFLDENVFMVGEATTFGSVTIKRNAQISGNATVRNGLTIGEGALVGAGAVVTRNVKDYTILSGNPARELVFPKG